MPPRYAWRALAALLSLLLARAALAGTGEIPFVEVPSVTEADRMLWWGHPDPVRGEVLETGAFRAALKEYLAAGVELPAIAAKVRERLEAFLAAGRRAGYSAALKQLESGVSAPALPSQPVPAAEAFVQRQRMDGYRRLHRELGIDRSFAASWDSPAGSYYTVSLEAALEMARFTGDAAAVSEVRLHMVRTGKFHDACKGAEETRDDENLFHMGMLSFVDFFYGEHQYYYNYDFEAIECLKRIQGRRKEKAAEVLRDYALMASSPEFLARTGAETVYLSHAMRALRATGTVRRKHRVDSVKVEFLTDVRSSPYAGDLRALAERIAADPKLSTPMEQELRMAYLALGDKERAGEVSRERRARIRRQDAGLPPPPWRR